jgi:hypothetical protein
MESRIDALAPTVFGNAGLDDPPLVGYEASWGANAPNDSLEPQPITELELTSDQHWVFIQKVKLRFVNYSNNPAQIDIVYFSDGEVDGAPQGKPIVLEPSQSVTLDWHRRVVSRALETDDEIAKWSTFNLRYWVRDIAMQMQDVYQFSGSTVFFRRNGSRLLVSSTRFNADWLYRTAGRTEPRTYPLLDQRLYGND